MPLSEDEQRILHEMEQKLYEHDRAFVDRVRARRPGASGAGASLRTAATIFVVGFAVVLVSFRSSLVLATFGFLVMLSAALLFERGTRHAPPATDGSASGGSADGANAAPAAERGAPGRRFRGRFWHHG